VGAKLDGEGNCRISKSGGIGSFLPICAPRAAALAPVAVAAPGVALRARTDNRVCRRGSLNVRFASESDQVAASSRIVAKGQSTKSLRDSEASGLSEIYTHVRQRFE
jgi:hypothetical protein